MKKVSEILRAGNILVADGAWGTEMYKRGLKAGECPDLWPLEHPDDVYDIARRYIDAGADLVETCSFGANRFKLEFFGKEELAADINEAAAVLSKKAAADSGLVMASIGPTGKMLLMGDVTEEELYDAFSEQAAALERGGADIICIETMSDADEACLAVRAVKETTALEVAASFSFEKKKNGEFRTMMGLTPAEAAQRVLDEGADIIGANCGNGMAMMAGIVAEIKQAFPDALILVNANAGLPENIDGEDIFPDTPEDMAEQARAVIEAGAVIIGGCCGTTPAHIKALKTLAEEFNMKE